MDYSSPLISLLIAAYGVYEFRRRREAHRLIISRLRGGEIPPEIPAAPRRWSLITTASVCMMLLACVVALLWLGLRTGTKAGPELLMVGCVLAIPLIILIMILVRDGRELRRARRQEAQ